ncbi:hypothetical protein GYMLUDRAFT_77877 [Collybiopsis luxurians FD-317 M1]|uniref:ASST-domain-containing protein n=1 Tax=Collybiopsis luxurians FD-317 M1 TaxID=944289 RepID=A0A0D0C369_9AGAR|nr:hypothetical protein GYMLUDRAFT_77877 [Collybiopsis luxurians FD-317 M1]
MKSFLLAPVLFAVVIISQCANASVAFCKNRNYELGILGQAPLQAYNAAPFAPPQINYAVPPADCPSNKEVQGFIFFSPLCMKPLASSPASTLLINFYLVSDAPDPGSGSKGAPGAIILNPNGTLVYSAFQSTDINALTFRLGVQRFRGKYHLVVWIGAFDLFPGFGSSGYNLLLDETYTIVANITVTPDLNAGPDLHELQITPNDTAIMTAYPAQAANLSVFGGPENGFILNCVAQEVEIETGEAVFTWHSLDHVEPGECFAEIGQTGDGTADDPWDFFHINSVQKLDDGNYFISSRHCHTLYLVNPSGDIIWRMGGKRSDFTFEPGANYSWQHHARMHNNNTISVFNNGASTWEQDFAFSQGLLLKYNMSTMTVSLINSRTPFNHILSQGEGSMQVMENGHSLVGWGQQPYYSQHDENGNTMWSAQFGLNSSAYRTFLHDWVGRPNTPPSVHVSNASSFNNVSVYAWWNGATEVTAWQLLGANTHHASQSSPTDNIQLSRATTLGDPVGKYDFETTLTYHGRQGDFEFYQVAALDANGHVLGYSNFTSLNGTVSFRADTTSSNQA